jgi:hypothetical protein
MRFLLTARIIAGAIVSGSATSQAIKGVTKGYVLTGRGR